MTRSFLFIALAILLSSLIAATAIRRNGASPAVAQQKSPTAPRRETTDFPPQGQTLRSSAADEKKMTTLEVAKSSKRTVLARCRSVAVREVAGGNIYTFYEFDVLRDLKDATGEGTLTLRLLGGRVGNSEITPVLDIQFVPERKYVLFLGRENAAGYPTIAGQSIFQVRTNPLDQGEIVVPSPTGLKLYRAKDGQRYSDAPELLPLEDFLFSITKLNG